MDAWDVSRLVRLSRGLPVTTIDPSTIAELDENHWYFHGSVEPTPRDILEHIKLVLECDLSFPVILDASGRVMDGMHRVCRAVLEGVYSIPAVQFRVDPEPDHTGCDPDELAYEDQESDDAPSPPDV